MSFQDWFLQLQEIIGHLKDIQLKVQLAPGLKEAVQSEESRTLNEWAKAELFFCLKGVISKAIL